MSAVRVAIVDSGANVPHPHLPGVAGGLALDFDGNETDDWVDRLGHGTAAAAAIHEKAPDAELHVVKVFDRELATTVRTLVKAIDWASARGFRLVNLSLGTPLAFREPELEPAVRRAEEAGTLIVSAYEHEGQRWYPGCMSGVIGVIADPAQPRESVALVPVEAGLALRASPYPRPIPGVPPERNLNGISFAVANATGCLAAALAERHDVRSAEGAVRLFEPTGAAGLAP